MLMKLEMPLINPSLRAGHVVEWNKDEGERFEFGDVICSIMLDEFAALRRTARATLLAAGKRRRALRSEVEVRDGKVGLRAELLSSDRGVLQRIVAEAGDRIRVGDVLAVVATHEPGEDMTSVGTLSEMPAMRVAANLGLDHETDDSQEVG